MIKSNTNFEDNKKEFFIPHFILLTIYEVCKVI